MTFTPADNSDTWYRWILKAAEPQRDRSGLYKYFEKYFVVPEEERPWLYELSGRLQSIGPNFREDAARLSAKLNGENKKRFEYRGRWLARVDVLRAGSSFDVYSEPIFEPHVDEAHANLVCLDAAMFDETGKIIPFVVVDLLAQLNWEAA